MNVVSCSQTLYKERVWLCETSMNVGEEKTEKLFLLTMLDVLENPTATQPSASPSRVKSKKSSFSGLVFMPTK